MENEIANHIPNQGNILNEPTAEDLGLPEKPVEPLQSDCCGTGCTPCVFDIYDQELELWRKQCKRIKSGLQASTGNVSLLSAVSPTEYRPFTIEAITRDSPNTFIYRFTLPVGGKLGLNTGQHLVLRHSTNGRSSTRQYTPVSDVDTEDYFDVMIKIYDDGFMSQYIRTWSVGDEIEWRGPFGSFSYTPNKWRRIIMLAAGTGIAPMAQVISTILNKEEDETLVRLFYACRTYEEILLKSTIDLWADYWNFSGNYFLTQDSPERKCKKRYGDKIHYSRITEVEISMELNGKVEDTLFLICGTKSFDKDMVNYLSRLSVPTSNYFKF